MKKAHKVLLILLLVVVFISGVIIKIPAWVVGSLASKYSDHRVSTSYETGTFWDGGAILLASDSNGKTFVPITKINWKIKLGLTKFIDVTFMSSGQTIANINLTKGGVMVNSVNLDLSMDQITPFLGNLSTLNLSGTVHVSANSLQLGKSNSGLINVTLQDVGSGMSPLNPIGSYNVKFDVAKSSIDVTTNGDSIIGVNASGNLNSLALNSTVQADKKDQMLQFMTMMGIPQPDGSYKMKVF